MVQETKKLELPTLAILFIMALVLWGAIAYLLFAFVKPEMSLDHGRTYVFDHLALIEATSIMSSIAILSWVPVFIFAWRRSRFLSAALAAASTWVCLGFPFLLIDRYDLFDIQAIQTFRASRVMEDGNDLIFLPLLIPLIAIFSGASYLIAMGLAIQLKAIIQGRHQRAS